MTEKTCAVCGRSLLGKRAGTKTCGDGCRARKSRLARDPKIGSPDRRARQRAALDSKYTYRQRKQARHALQRLGLLPSGWSKSAGGGDPRGEPEFDNTPWLEWRRGRSAEHDSTKPLWVASDGWPVQETLLALNHVPKRRYRRRLSANEIEASPFYFSSVYALMEMWGSHVVESDIRPRERSEDFRCRGCGQGVSTRHVLSHVCKVNALGFVLNLTRLTVTGHIEGEEEEARACLALEDPRH